MLRKYTHLYTPMVSNWETDASIFYETSGA